MLAVTNYILINLVLKGISMTTAGMVSVQMKTEYGIFGPLPGFVGIVQEINPNFTNNSSTSGHYLCKDWYIWDKLQQIYSIFTSLTIFITAFVTIYLAFCLMHNLAQFGKHYNSYCVYVIPIFKIPCWHILFVKIY